MKQSFVFCFSLSDYKSWLPFSFFSPVFHFSHLYLQSFIYFGGLGFRVCFYFRFCFVLGGGEGPFCQFVLYSGVFWFCRAFCCCLFFSLFFFFDRVCLLFFLLMNTLGFYSSKNVLISILVACSFQLACTMTIEDFLGQDGGGGQLVTWCFEPSQPQRITSGLWRWGWSEILELSDYK